MNHAHVTLAGSRWTGLIRTAFIAALLAAPSLPAHAADGDLDPAFGTGGKVTTDFLGKPTGLGGYDRGSSVAIQADGKIVTAGAVDAASGAAIMALVRYNPDGTLDSTFGTGGKVALDFFDWNYTPAEREGIAIVIQPDGRIVLAGTVGDIYTSALPDFGVARFNTDGSLDSSFGGGVGWVLTDIGGLFGQPPSQDGATSVALQADGKIVAAGFTRPSFSDFAIVRYTADGTLDTTFGAGSGAVVIDFAGTEDWANGVAIQADGRIVAAGVASSPTYVRSFGLVRLDSDGTPDTTFGPSGNGRVTTGFFDWTEGDAVAIQPSDGKIVVAGQTYINVVGQPLTYFDFALARYDTNGALDGTFGVGGKATADIQGGFDGARAVVIQADGRIVAAGYHADLSDVETAVDMAVVRFTTDGVPDATFGSGGAVTTAFDGVDVAQSVAIQGDCKIVVAGATWVIDAGGWEYDSNFALARYDGGTCGTPPPAFRCPLSQGYWSTHGANWPVASLTLGSQVYTATQLAAILNASSAGDASLILGQQLIAAKLNVANGSDPGPISSTIADADALLAGFAGTLPYKVKTNTAVGKAMTADGKLLESYNLGQVTPSCTP